MRRLISLLLLAAALTAGLTLRADAGSPQTQAVRLQLKWLNQAQFAGYYAAQQQGYYAHEGLTVTVLPGGPNIAPEDVVNNGNAEFGVDWLSALLVARDHGAPLVNIAQVFQASGMRLVTFKSSGIQKIEDFAGKRVGVWPAGNEYQFYALMNKYRFSPPEQYMTVVQQPFDMTPFFTKQIDVAHAMTYNELDTVYRSVGKSQVRVFDYNRLGVNILEDGLFAREDWLQSHGDTAVKFLRASIRGWQWAVAHPVPAGKLAYQRAAPGTSGGLPHQITMAKEVAKLIKAGNRRQPIGYMDPALYQRTWKTLLDEHVLSAEPSGAYTVDYWQEATAR